MRKNFVPRRKLITTDILRLRDYRITNTLKDLYPNIDKLREFTPDSDLKFESAEFIDDTVVQHRVLGALPESLRDDIRVDNEYVSANFHHQGHYPSSVRDAYLQALSYKLYRMDVFSFLLKKSVS